MGAAEPRPAVRSGYSLPVFPYRRPAELDGAKRRHPVAVVGGGLCGLSAACDLACRGIPVVLLDEDDTVGVRGASSRGIVYAQKTLEIFDRLGIYERIAAKGVTWSVGKVLADDDLLYAFDAARG
jgi:3-(3-hydroxy-phenyl)propionate hydroxylase